MQSALTVWDKICCPVDYSEGARAALRLAASLARTHDADLVILHAHTAQIELVAELYSLTMAQVADRTQELREGELARWCQAARELGAPRVEGVMVAGDADRAIVEFARKHHVDLIVMGTHGRTGLRHLLMGSVAERVVRLARCPVLTTGAEPPAQPTRRHDATQPSCRDLMHKNVGFVHAHTALADAARKMADLEADFLPVVDADGHLLGALTDRDVVLGLARSTERASIALVGEVMSRGVTTCGCDDDAGLAVARAAHRGARRAVVVNDDGVVQGVLEA